MEDFISMKIITPEYVREKFPVRDNSFHKGDLGRVLIVAGSYRYPGTGVICGRAAMRAGAGLVSVATSSYARGLISSSLFEVMSLSYEDDEILDTAASSSDVIAIGPGLGRDESGQGLIEKILSFDKKIIVDADGIFHLKKYLNMVKGKDILITPHEGEFSNIAGKDIDSLKNDRQSCAEEFAEKYGIKVLLKGKNTIITDGGRSFYTDKGSCKMATGGMGDALTGIIAAFAAGGQNLFDAAVSGAYIHSLTADMLAKDRYTVLAGDVIEKLPYVIESIVNGK